MGLLPARRLTRMYDGQETRGRQGTDKVLLGSAGIVGNAVDITVDELMQSFTTIATTLQTLAS